MCFRSYSEVVNFLLKQYVIDPAIAKYDATILRYMKQADTTSNRYTERLVATLCKVTYIYDKGTQIDVIIEDVDASIYRSLPHYWMQNPQADSIDIVYKAELLMSIQKDAGNTPDKNRWKCITGRPFNRKRWNSRSTLNIIYTDTISLTPKAQQIYQIRYQYPTTLHNKREPCL